MAKHYKEECERCWNKHNYPFYEHTAPQAVLDDIHIQRNRIQVTITPNEVARNAMANEQTTLENALMKSDMAELAIGDKVKVHSAFGEALYEYQNRHSQLDSKRLLSLPVGTVLGPIEEIEVVNMKTITDDSLQMAIAIKVPPRNRTLIEEITKDIIESVWVHITHGFRSFVQLTNHNTVALHTHNTARLSSLILTPCPGIDAEPNEVQYPPMRIKYHIS